MTKRTAPKPGYTTTKPYYPAVSDMLTTLGSQDTKLNLDEVALRFFERISDTGKKPTEFVNAVCAHMGVNTSLRVPWAEFRRNGHQFAIAQTMAVADAFFRRLGREYRAYNQIDAKAWKAQIDGEQLDALRALCENLQDPKKARSYPEHAVIQYYRLIRNRVIHRSGKDTNTPLTELLDAHEKHIRECYGTIPSKYEAVNYDDFVLLTRAIKYYARALNDACALKPEQILRFHLSRLHRDNDSADVTGPMGPLPWLFGLRRLKGRMQRFDRVVHAFAVHYVLSRGDTLHFADLLRDFIKKDGSAKERRRYEVAQQAKK